jgi:hypothetical protein
MVWLWRIPWRRWIMDTPSVVAGTWVVGDKREYMRVSAGKQEVACTSPAVVAWQLVVSMQQVGSKSWSANMRLAKTDVTGKDRAEGYAIWPPAEPGLNDSCYTSLQAEDIGQSQSSHLVYPISVK